MRPIALLTIALGVRAGAAWSGEAVQAPSAPAGGNAALIPCSSKLGEPRQYCAADTSRGVALARLTGDAPCLLGKTWGYDDNGIWVADGCSGEFLALPAAAGQAPTAPAPT